MDVLMKLSSLVTYPLSWLFQLLVGLKNTAYDRGWLKVDHLEQPVISVGNLSMGGTGKSPICSDLAARLMGAGKKTALLSRGYGRDHAGSRRIVDADSNWRKAGDEPVMIARRHPQLIVSVGPTRLAAAQLTLSYQPHVFLIDDGFQHRRLHRDLDLVLIDVTQPLPQPAPRAPFREGWPALKRAHGVILTRWDGTSNLEVWERAVGQTNPEIPILKAGFRPTSLVAVDGSQRWPLSILKGKRIGAYAGIAQPEKFFKSLRQLGCQLAVELALGDHQPLRGPAMSTFLQNCRDQQVAMVVTTEKDAVKLENPGSFDILMGFLAIDVFWHDEAILDRLLFSVLD